MLSGSSWLIACHGLTVLFPFPTLNRHTFSFFAFTFFFTSLFAFFTFLPTFFISFFAVTVTGYWLTVLISFFTVNWFTSVVSFSLRYFNNRGVYLIGVEENVDGAELWREAAPALSTGFTL